MIRYLFLLCIYIPFYLLAMLLAPLATFQFQPQIKTAKA